MKNVIAGRSREAMNLAIASGKIDPEITAAIQSGSKRIIDHIIYGVRACGTSTLIKVFKDDDKKVVGTTNLSSAKLEKGQIFSLSSIQILSAVHATDPQLCDFGKIAKEIANGQFTLKVNGVDMIKEQAMSCFAVDQSVGQLAGVLELENPIIILSQTPINLDIELGTTAATNTYVKVCLIGSVVS